MTEIEHGGVRWPENNTLDYHNDQLDNEQNEDDWDGANNSAKLFERSRIKALAGECPLTFVIIK